MILYSHECLLMLQMDWVMLVGLTPQKPLILVKTKSLCQPNAKNTSLDATLIEISFQGKKWSSLFPLLNRLNFLTDVFTPDCYENWTLGAFSQKECSMWHGYYSQHSKH